MKSFLLCFIILVLNFHSHGQKVTKNEIGLGIGRLSYTRLNRPTLNNKWHSTLIFQTSRRNYNSAMESATYKESRMNLPVLHYSRHFDKRNTIRISYQYSRIVGSEDTMWRAFSATQLAMTDFKSKMSTHDMYAGYSFKFISRKKLQAYVAFDINYKRSHIRTSAIDHTYSQSPIYATEQNHFVNFNQAFGCNVALNSLFSLGFETSIFYETGQQEIYLRPINRLSVNYQF